MAFVKLLHVLFIFIWVGNLMALTRLLGYHNKLDDTAQLQMGKIYRRMHLFVGMPCLALAFLLGSFMILQIDQEKGLFWFILKLTFASGLIICEFVCGHYISLLTDKNDHSRGVRYKVLHGVCGLLLIGVLTCIYILKPAVVT